MKKIIIVLACFLLTGCALQETKEPTENPLATAPAESTPEASAEAKPNTFTGNNSVGGRCKCGKTRWKVNHQRV